MDNPWVLLAIFAGMLVLAAAEGGMLGSQAYVATHW